MSLRRSRESNGFDDPGPSRRVRFNETIQNHSEDEEEEDLEQRKRKHGEVNLDGYGSQDSLDEVSDHEKENGNKDDGDDDDMFAEPSAPKVRTNFEGQELNSREQYESSEGIQIEAFNMKGDMELGQFDENDNFVWNKKDENAHHDNWMTGVSREEMEKAKLAQQDRERKIAEKEQLTDQKSSFQKASDIKLELIQFMNPGETILSVLSRLRVKKPKFNKNKKSEQNDETSEDTADKKQKIEKITELTEKLIDKGELDIYSARFEDLVRTLKAEEVLATSWKHGDPTDKESQMMYEYKWKEGDDTYGPYSRHEMREWHKQGYFEAGILIRESYTENPFEAPNDTFFSS